MFDATVIGSVGVGLLLVAFFLNLFKKIGSGSREYAALNMVGGALAAYASFLINFMPFVVLEGMWALFALYKLTKLL